MQTSSQSNNHWRKLVKNIGGQAQILWEKCGKNW